MRFVTIDECAALLRDRTVAIVGSAPSCAENAPGFVDSHDVVVRVNNYRTGPGQGFRTDVHYSFYGTSVRKRAEELKRDGVKLCMCKCPDAKPIECDWHETNGKQIGIDFRYIYKARASWWFTDTYVPTVERFLESFNLLGRHIPSTGFAAILEVLACAPRTVYLTGFDFFTSGLHNVNEPWRAGDPADPIGHRPELESAWLWRAWQDLDGRHYPILFDEKLHELMETVTA